MNNEIENNISLDDLDNYLIISPNCKTYKPNKIITFDTETYRYEIKDGELLKFFNMDFYDGIEHYYSENLNDLFYILDKLKKKYKKITYFAHNISFDIRTLHLLPYLINEKFLGLFRKKVMMDNIFYIKFQSKDRNYINEWLDSRNYFRTSLENIAEMFNLSKEDIEEYDLSSEEWNKQLLISGKKRVLKDTEILYIALESFFNMEISHGLSIASSSLSTFRNQYLKTKIYLPKFVVNYALESYHGGIVLPYKLVENKELYSFDINSLYPYVMKNNPYSIKYHSLINNYKWLYDDIKNNNYNYLLKVKYKIDGYSPIFDKYDNQLIPFLENEVWITGKEYQTLYENNAMILIEKCYDFHNDYIFKEFIEDIYNKRKLAKTEYESQFLKLIMNSLYGKLAQHKAHSKFLKISEIKNPMIRYILENSNQQRITINDEIYSIYENFVSILEDTPIRYNPLIASEITANSRLLNYEYSKIFGFDNLYYTDTDSFFTSVRKPFLEDNKEIGKLKLEKVGIFNIYAPKDYTFYGKCNKKKCKICKDEYGIHTTIKGIHDIDSLEGHKYLNKKWSGIKFSINNDNYIEYREQYIRRINKKMFYTNGIGREWLNKKEYDKYNVNKNNAPSLIIK